MEGKINEGGKENKSRTEAKQIKKEQRRESEGEQLTENSYYIIPFISNSKLTIAKPLKLMAPRV